MTLQQQIDRKRADMIELALEKGFTHAEVVEASQELDQLLNTAQKTQMKEAKSA